MSTPVEFEGVVPVVPVRDLQAALERYRKLGFAVRAYGHGTGYGYADRGRVSIHLSEWNQHDPKKTGSVVYSTYRTRMPCERNGWPPAWRGASRKRPTRSMAYASSASLMR